MEEIALEVNEKQCSACSICSSICPFEAIRKEGDKITLDMERCHLCGICYTACPAGAISAAYYNTDSLVSYLEQAKVKYNSRVLVLMCKASAPPFAEIEEIFSISNFIPLSLPCVGRIPVEFLLTALAKGIERICIIACEEDDCRFKEGSIITKQRVFLLKRLLEQLGYERDVITLKRHGLMLNTPVDYETLSTVSPIIGYEGMAVTDKEARIIDTIYYFLFFAQKSSCSKCVPCRVGMKQVLHILERMRHGEGHDGDIEQLQRIAETVKLTSLCPLGRTAAYPVLNTVRDFRSEYEACIQKGNAGVSHSYRSKI